jgi:hypothetical protein
VSLRVKGQGSKVDRSPPYSIEVKNGGGIPPFLYTSSWRDVLLINPRGKFIFTLRISGFVHCLVFRIGLSVSEWVLG